MAQSMGLAARRWRMGPTASIHGGLLNIHHSHQQRFHRVGLWLLAMAGIMLALVLFPNGISTYLESFRKAK